jgi:hypothetical protein
MSYFRSGSMKLRVFRPTASRTSRKNLMSWRYTIVFRENHWQSVEVFARQQRRIRFELGTNRIFSYPRRKGWQIRCVRLELFTFTELWLSVSKGIVNFLLPSPLLVLWLVIEREITSSHSELSQSPLAFWKSGIEQQVPWYWWQRHQCSVVSFQ